MKLASLFLLPIAFSAASSSPAEAKDKLVSTTRIVDHPIVLADVSASSGEESPRFDDLASDLPDYCYDALDLGCYRRGVPRCCRRTRRQACPTIKPRCERARQSERPIPARTTTRSIVGPGDYCNPNLDACVMGYACLSGICRASSSGPVARGRTCRAGVDACVRGTACIDGICAATRRTVPGGRYCNIGYGDVCAQGYLCIDARCERAARSPRSNLVPGGGYCNVEHGDICAAGYQCIDAQCERPARYGSIVRPGEVCQAAVDVCEEGYACIDGRCTVPLVPRGGACRSGGTACADDLVCLDGICDAGRWYTNWQYCVMDCPSAAGPCCGGGAQSYDQVYASVEACCGQSAFQGNHDGCTNRSLQCATGSADDEKVVEKSE